MRKAPTKLRPIFLDCEASGWPPHGYVIEVAWAEPGGPIESHLIRPHRSWTYWSEQAEAVPKIRSRSKPSIDCSRHRASRSGAEQPARFGAFMWRQLLNL